MSARVPGRLQTLRRVFDQAARFILLTGLCGLIAIATMTIVDVLGRWAFNRPLTGSSDIAEATLPVVVAASIPVLITLRGQITIRFAEMVLPRRATFVLDVVAETLTLVVLLGMAVALGGYATGLFASSEVTWIISLKLWPTWSCFGALIGFAAIMQAFVLIETISGRDAQS
ncbi:TRAP transporter small permease subunit [Brucella anthropi]|uniref:TRAP transporter small permease protein n=1 Tax=Brucella anthropi TaxID=529 RepID=A0A6I0DI80_BRUAN|nr:TRAP transporter small permease subunit [Brucella anthropi]KAB2790316.1 TRAP transporter small permease subunit [Brucella anthropi]